MNPMDKDVRRERERQTEDQDSRGGVGKRTAKLGLALIAVLVLILIGVFVMKLSGGGDQTPAPDATKRTASLGTNPNAVAWKTQKPPAPSFDQPTVVTPKSSKPGLGRPAQSKRWSLGSSTDASMMPDESVGATSAEDVAVMPAPAPTDRKRGRSWDRSSTTVARSSQSGGPPNAFAPAPTQTASSTTYPNPYYSARNSHGSNGAGAGAARSAAAPGGSAYGNAGYGSSNSSYGTSSYGPSSYGASSAESNPYRSPSGATQSASSSPRDGSTQGGYPYSRQNYGNAGNSGNSYGPYQNGSSADGYQQAPYTQKTANPYSTPGYTPSTSYPSSAQSPYSTGYGEDSFNTRSSGFSSSLGGRRDDGKYVVGPNDSFAAISRRLYGTDAFYRALAEMNRDKFPEEDQLRVGDVILAPDEAELTEKYPDLCPAPERREIIRGRISAVSTGSRYQTGPTYTVQSGDTLFDIAEYKLGDGARWPEIYELNREALQGDFNYVTPGMTLTLPDESSESVTRRPATGRSR